MLTWAFHASGFLAKHNATIRTALKLQAEEFNGYAASYRTIPGCDELADQQAEWAAEHIAAEQALPTDLPRLGNRYGIALSWMSEHGWAAEKACAARAAQELNAARDAARDDKARADEARARAHQLTEVGRRLTDLLNELDALAPA